MAPCSGLLANLTPTFWSNSHPRTLGQLSFGQVRRLLKWISSLPT